MPAGNAYPSGHLVPSAIVGLACAPIVETRFLELAMSLLDFSHRIPLGTFSIFLKSKFLCQYAAVMSLADKCIVVGCFVFGEYDKILMETGKFSANIRVTKDGLVSSVDRVL